MTTYNDFGGYGHPDHIRTHLVAVGAFARAGDPAWYPEQLAPEHGGTRRAVGEGGLAPWTPAKLYEQAIPASVRTRIQERMEAIGERSFWSPAGGRHAGAARGVRGVSPRRCWSPTSRSRRGWTSPTSSTSAGRPSGPRDPDQRREPVRALRADAWARLLVQGGVRPPREPGPGAGRETDLFEGLGASATPGRVRLGRRASAQRPRRRSLAGERPPAPLPGEQALPSLQELVHHELPSRRPAGSMKFGCALPMIRWGRIRI